jgi:hypothetical protein
MDPGSGHQATSLVIPAHVVCLFFPSYRPELNPIERLWRELNDQLAWVLAAAGWAVAAYVPVLTAAPGAVPGRSAVPVADAVLLAARF